MLKITEETINRYYQMTDLVMWPLNHRKRYYLYMPYYTKLLLIFSNEEEVSNEEKQKYLDHYSELWQKTLKDYPQIKDHDTFMREAIEFACYLAGLIRGYEKKKSMIYTINSRLEDYALKVQIDEISSRLE